MKRIRISILVMLGMMSCAAMAQNVYNIVPKPAKLTAKSGKFVFDKDTRIVLSEETTEMLNAAYALQEPLMLSRAWMLKTARVGDVPTDKNVIVCKLNPSIKNMEAYKMTITPKRIEVEASAANGIFYAMQTLRQLLPADVERVTTGTVELSVPCAVIEDEPRYAYRGFLLDVARHFSTVKAVKHYLDLLAFHKINTFHWHLTDDQGWRVEIKKYPKLSEISAWRDRTLIGRWVPTGRKYDQTRYGGIYTQEEIKDVVAYARKKFITVIPEIEMPGHAIAALAAYPELSCTGGPFEVEGLWGVFNDVYCPNEETFAFLQGVIDEIIPLFPGTYIHIGGDECPKVRWERCYHCRTKMKELGLKDAHALQSYFIQRMEKYINSKGRRIIGWDEILEGGLADDATVMSWRGTEGGVAAARQGHDVIMTPTKYCYFDYLQGKDKSREPLSIGGYVPLDSVYTFDPTPAVLNADEAKHILGAQANLWTEYIPTVSGIEYMMLPRLAALSEVVWTPKKERDFDDFEKRLKSGIVKHYDVMGVNYSKSNLE